MPELRITSRTKFTCPLCMSGDAVISRDEYGNPYVICFACRDREGSGLSGGDWLRAVAAEVDAPGGGALKDDPERWLEPYLNGANRRGSNGPDELPNLSKVVGWHKALLSHQGALDYLRHERRLSMRAIRTCKLGYAEHGAPGAYRDSSAITIPVFDHKGKVVNLRKRFWPSMPILYSNEVERVKYVGLTGRGVQLYPNRPHEWLSHYHTVDAILVAGEFDALVGRQMRLPTVSTTCGCNLTVPLAEELVRGYVDDDREPLDDIAVLFDIGEDKAAERAVDLLRTASSHSPYGKVWTVRLDRLMDLYGWEQDGITDLSDYIAAGGNRDELLEMIQYARRS